MATIEIGDIAPPVGITVMTDGRDHLKWFEAHYVPSVGDEIEIKDDDRRWHTYRVVRRRWDLTERGTPVASLFVVDITTAVP